MLSLPLISLTSLLVLSPAAEVSKPISTHDAHAQRYVAGAPVLMQQICAPFISGQSMAPVLKDIAAWPAHPPLSNRLLQGRDGHAYLTRQFGYGLYGVVLQQDGQCSVEVFGVPSDLAMSHFRASTQGADAFERAASVSARTDKYAERTLTGRSGASLHFSLSLDGQASAASARFSVKRVRPAAVSI